MTRIQITGSREFTDYETIVNAIQEHLDYPHEHPGYENVVVHGGARGADTLAGEAARHLGVKVEVFPANWEKYGKLAGPIRNVQMLDTYPDIVLAFYKHGAKNIGTRNLVNEALLRSIPVSEYWEE